MPRHPVDDAERAKSGRALVRLVHSHLILHLHSLSPQSNQDFLCKGERAVQNSTTLHSSLPGQRCTSGCSHPHHHHDDLHISAKVAEIDPGIHLHHHWQTAWLMRATVFFAIHSLQTHPTHTPTLSCQPGPTRSGDWAHHIVHAFDTHSLSHHRPQICRRLLRRATTHIPDIKATTLRPERRRIARVSDHTFVTPS